MILRNNSIYVRFYHFFVVLRIFDGRLKYSYEHTCYCNMLSIRNYFTVITQLFT